MKIERDFNVSVSYPSISKTNVKIIQEYHDNVLCKIESDGTYLGYLYALKELCNEINQPMVPDLTEWDYNTADAYISQVKCTYQRMVLVVKVTKNLMYFAGYNNSLAKLKASNYGLKYRVPFFTFNEMDEMIRRAYDSTHPKIAWDELNDWSTSIVICYLLWLGFSKSEIAMLKNSDYDERSGTIVLEYSKSDDGIKRIKRRTIDEPNIESYLKRYINGNKFFQYNDYHGKRSYDYRSGESLIKIIIRDNVRVKDVVDYCSKKYSTFWGFTSDDVLLAGRMNRLYYYNIVKGMPVDKNNAKIIADCLDLDLPAKVFKNGELGNLILLYPSYKSERLNHN